MVNALQDFQEQSFNAKNWSFDQDFVDDQLEVILDERKEYDGSAFYMRENKETGETAAELCDKMAANPLYHSLVSKKEFNVFEKYAQELLRYAQKEKGSMVDLGVGGSGKSLKLMKKIDHIVDHVIGVDRSAKFHELHEQHINEANIKKGFNEKKTTYLKLLNDRTDQVIYERNKGLINYNGGSVGNNTPEINQKLFTSMGAGGSRHGFVTYFSAPTGEKRKEKVKELETAYSTREMQNWIMKGFDALGVPTDKLKFHAEYIVGKDGTPDMMTMGATVTMEFSMKVHGRTIHKKPGDVLQAINSRRYTHDQFRSMLGEANCTLKEIFEDDGVTVGVIKTPTTPLTKRITHRWSGLDTRVQYSLMATLGIGIGTGTTIAVNNHYQQKELQEIRQVIDLDQIRQTGNTYFGNLGYAEKYLEAILSGFDQLTQRAMGILSTAYNYDNLGSSAQKEIATLWQEFMINEHKPQGRYSDPELHYLMEEFIMNHPKTLSGHGLDLRPYQSRDDQEALLRSTYFAPQDYVVGSYKDHGVRGAQTTGYHLLPDKTKGLQWKVYMPQDHPFGSEKMISAVIEGERYLLEHDHDNDRRYNISSARAHATAFFEKGYVNLLSEHLVRKGAWIEAPSNMTQGQAMFQNHQRNIQSQISHIFSSVLIDLSAEGYDFGSLCYDTDKGYTAFFTTYVLPRLASHRDRTPQFAKHFEHMTDSEQDLREITDQIQTMLSHYPHTQGPLTTPMERALESELFFMLTSDQDTKSRLYNPLRIKMFIEENASVFAPYGFEILPFSFFEQYDAFFNNTETSTNIPFGEKYIMMATLHHPYTTLSGAEFSLGIVDDDDPESVIFALPANDIARQEIQAQYHTHRHDIAQGRYGTSFDTLEDFEQGLIPQIYNNITNDYCLLSGQHVAQDYFIQQKMRFRENGGKYYKRSQKKS